jgi:hypothetical protein
MSSSDESVSVTERQTLAERWARRVLARRAGATWAIWLIYFTENAVVGWAKRDAVFLTLDLTALVAVGMLVWERYGFRQVVDRYESELRRLRPPPDPA